VSYIEAAANADDMNNLLSNVKVLYWHSPQTNCRNLGPNLELYQVYGHSGHGSSVH
jgi:hypothetical protein